MTDFIHTGDEVPFGPSKDPDNTLFYGADWKTLGWLRDGEVITASEWILSPGLVSESEEFTPTETNILLSGGLAGELHVVTNRITTSLGQIVDKSFKLRIRES